MSKQGRKMFMQWYLKGLHDASRWSSPTAPARDLFWSALATVSPQDRLAYLGDRLPRAKRRRGKSAGKR